MELVSYNGIVFTSLGLVSPKFPDQTAPGPDRQSDDIPRLGADPMPGGILTGTQTIPVQFTPASGQNTETTFLKLLAALDTDDPYGSTLVATIGGVTVETDAKVGQWSYLTTNTMIVPFILTTPGWRAQSLTTIKPLAGDVVDGSVANGNTGYRDMLPAITAYWPAVTQRATATSDFGWRHRIGAGLTLTNTGTEPLTNQPYQIGPINHAAIVSAGQGLASGYDLRVFCEGQELRRNLLGANTKAMFVWVILPTIAPGQSITLDLLTNNPSASSPPWLGFNTDPPLPGMDLSGQSFKPTSTNTDRVTLSGAGWETNQWAGGTVVIGSSTTSRDKQTRRVASNTSDTIFFDEIVTLPSTSDDITVMKSGMRGGGGFVFSATSTTLRCDPLALNPNEWIGATLEILTGSGAGQRRTVVSNTATTFTVSPAFTTTPSSPDGFRVYQFNGQRMWDVRQPPKSTSYPGLWQANKITSPPTQVRFDAPGSWYRFTYQPNDDTYSQPRYDSINVGGSNFDHVPTMNIQRAKTGRVGGQKEVGIADAVGVSCPFPITGIRFGYTLRNAKKAGSGSPGEGMCEARFMVQEAGGELWSPFLSDVTVRNSTATISPAWYDLTGYGNPNRVAMTLIPNGSDEIPEADTNTAQLRSSGDSVRMAVNPQSVLTESIDWIASPPSTVAIYDFNLIVRTGGASATPPYHRVVIGGADHRLFITGTNERIVVDCERRTATIQTAAGVVVREVPWAVQGQQVVTGADGVNRTLVASRWLPIPPVSVDSDRIYFTDPSGAQWGSIMLGMTGRAGYRT